MIFVKRFGDIFCAHASCTRTAKHCCTVLNICNTLRGLKGYPFYCCGRYLNIILFMVDDTFLRTQNPRSFYSCRIYGKEHDLNGKEEVSFDVA